MSHRAVCSECSWTGDAETLNGAACEAGEHRDETGHDAKVERDLVTDGGVDQDDDPAERVVRNPSDASEVADHYEHEGFSVFRFGAGEVVDIHISCEECSVRYIIEDVPKDKAENPGKYLDSEEVSR